jgi:uncharacterized protein YbjT (DUF2867 family)
VSPPGADILVTGATGNLGHAVGAELLAAGIPVRAGDRDPERAADRLPGCDAIHLDFTDPDTFGAALASVRRVFLIRPPAIARVGPTINRFLDTAVDRGVEHVVFSSVAGAGSNPAVPHHRIEQHLYATGLGWTVLRPGFFAQNLAGPYRTDIRHGRLHVPAAQGRVAFLDVRDLGELAAGILADPTGHTGHAYTPTGPEAVTFTEVAALLTEELGRPVTYRPATAFGYLGHLARQRLPASQCLVQTILHLGLRRGDAEQVDPTLHQLLGRPPRTMATYIHDHRHLWTPPQERTTGSRSS